MQVASGATLGPGDPQTLTINGSLAVNGGSLLFQLAGDAPGQYDVLQITGSATFAGGTIIFDFLSGFAPSPGDLFGDILSVSGGLLGLGGVSYQFLGIDPAFQFQVDATNTGISVVAVGPGGEPGTVPEPPELALLFASLGLLGVGRMRSHARIH